MMKIIKWIIKLIVCILLFVVSVVVFDYFKEKPILEYCDQIKLGTTSEEVLEIAKEKNLFVLSSTKIEDKSIFVFNHRMPYFRYACILNFEEMKVVSKSTFMAD